MTEWLIYKLETDINQIYINLGISEDSQNFSFLPVVYNDIRLYLHIYLYVYVIWEGGTKESEVPW